MKVIKAHIKDGVVVNLSLGDTDRPWTPPDGITIVEFEKAPGDCVIGSTWDGKVFKRPLDPVIVPEKTIDDKLAEISNNIATLTSIVDKVQKDVDSLTTSRSSQLTA